MVLWARGWFTFYLYVYLYDFDLVYQIKSSQVKSSQGTNENHICIYIQDHGTANAPRDNSPSTVRQNELLTRAVYADRAKLIARIPTFWPSVFDEAPDEVDGHIQPRDVPALATLRDVEVKRFEVGTESQEDHDYGNGNDGGGGDPRSVQITLTFADNAWFEDRVLEKRFWYRKGREDGWTGLASEPVRIRWKTGKDLTDGLLNAAAQKFDLLRELDVLQGQAGGEDQEDRLRELQRKHKEAAKTLFQKLERQPRGARSFFAWFGYIGESLGSENSKKRKDGENAIHGGRSVANGKRSVGEEKETASSEETDRLAIEIFPSGEELAIAISEDLYPAAIKYFGRLTFSKFRENGFPLFMTDVLTVQSIKEDNAGSSDEELEDSDSDDFDDAQDDAQDDGQPVAKKVKTAVDDPDLPSH